MNIHALNPSTAGKGQKRKWWPVNLQEPLEQGVSSFYRQ